MTDEIVTEKTVTEQISEKWEKGEPDTAIRDPGEEVRRQARRIGSVLGWSLTLFMVMTMALGVVIQLAGPFSTAGVGGITLLSYGLTLPLVFWLMNRVPAETAEKKKMRFRKFWMFFILAQGGGTILNFAGNFINMMISRYSGQNPMDMNPVLGLSESMDLVTLLYVAVLGPLVEEYIFRWKILNRLRPLGEKAAILYSALAFGLLHGNITQFLYAAFIGLILGYMAVKTGRLLYCCLLHIGINSWSAVLMMLTVSSSRISLWLSLMMLAAMLLMIPGAVIIFALQARNTRLLPGRLPEGFRYRDIRKPLYCNGGNLAFMGISVALMVFYMVGA